MAQNQGKNWGAMFWWSIDTITYPWTKHWSKCYPGDWWQTMHLHIRPRGRLFQRFGVAHMICSVPAGLYNAQSLFSRPYAKSCKFPKHPLYQVLKQYIPWICNNLKLLISEIFLTPSVQVEKNTLLLMADILHQLMLVVYSHYLQGFSTIQTVVFLWKFLKHQRCNEQSPPS